MLRSLVGSEMCIRDRSTGPRPQTTMSPMLRRAASVLLSHHGPCTMARCATTAVHFKNSPNPHPLGMHKEWKNPTINHVWSADELEAVLAQQPRHVPQKLGDKAIHAAIRGLYRSFNFMTGYKGEDPSPSAVAFRLILLESVAGVPGFVAASHRHFKSLRSLERDHGWIHTLLEEAENERMHLLTFLQLFPASWSTRAIVYSTQYLFGAMFIGMYVLAPQLAHRFVGYFEETAVLTYSQVISKMEEDGTQLNKQWSDVKAPPIAVNYWRLPAGASLLDAIKQIAADEAVHRDVNHTFADMAYQDPNPFVEKHLENVESAYKAWRADSTEAVKILEGTEMQGMSLNQPKTSTTVG
eukprot:TRINITY_DN15042_c0_g1_i1.p1 TRINITY_DN15042_c0_g1~~TRINITY_DN15042_c0_g1_i1.p1  ORF type:complete len:354 (+),score=86.54 TRINITY_DN15042_c0_g1_i1:58-1119(+)